MKFLKQKFTIIPQEPFIFPLKAPTKGSEPEPESESEPEPEPEPTFGLAGAGAGAGADFGLAPGLCKLPIERKERSQIGYKIY